LYRAAEALRRDWSHRLVEIDQEYSPTERKSNELAAERDILRKQLDALEAKKTKMEAALTPPPAEPAENNAIDTPEYQQDVDPDDEVDDVTAHAADSDGVDDQTIAQESAEDIAKRVASQWIPGSSDDTAAAAAAEEEQEHEQHSEEDYVENENSDADEEDHEFDQGDAYEPSLDALASAAAVDGSGDVSSSVNGEESSTSALGEFDLGIVGSVKAWIAETLAKLLGKPADAAELERVRATVDSIRSRYEAANNAYETASSRVYALKSEREGLETKINRSYGPDDVFAQLVDRCVEAHVDKYVYKVCPFHQAEQLEGGHGPRLGTWKGFDDSGEHMLFDDGDVCWQGPNRSMTVRIHCGATETLTKVAEPSRCEYTAEMTTPAVCNKDSLMDLRAAIAAKQALLDIANSGVKDEL
jgi:protein kinase C substrate 80K-H